MSTTLLIGRWPAASSRALQPQRRGADLDVGEHAGGEARAELGHLDRHRGVVGDLARRRSPRRPASHGGAASSAPGDRVHLAGDAVDAEAVDPVGGQLELEHRLGDRQRRRRAGARRARRRSSTMIPSASSPISSSVSERIIPSDSTPRSFALPSFVAVRASPRRAARPRRSGRRRRWARRRRSCARRRRCRPRRR